MTEFTLVAQKIKRMTLEKEVVTLEGREGERDGRRNDKFFFSIARERVIYLFIILKNILIYIDHFYVVLIEENSKKI